MHKLLDRIINQVENQKSLTGKVHPSVQCS